MMVAKPKRPRVVDQIRNAAAEFRRAGLTYGEIGGRLGVSGGLVCRAIKPLGIPAPPRDRSKGGRRGVCNRDTKRLSPWPTSHPPGSPERVAVLAERAEGGYALWHPDDAV